jgi:hypothetical protein
MATKEVTSETIPRAQQPIDPELADAFAALDGAKGKEREHAYTVLGTLLVLECYERRGLGIPDPRFFDGVVPAYHEMVDPLFQGKEGIDACANALPMIAGAIACKATPPIRFGFDFLGARQLSVGEKQRVLPALNRELRRPLTVMNRIVAVKAISVGTEEGTILRHHAHSYHRDGIWWQMTGRREAWVAFAMAVLGQTLARKEWSVRVRLSDATPSVCLFTDPAGVLAFFRLRDVPPGKSRRDALAHWVREHYRRSRVDPDAAIRVREHLRGTRAFRWHGMGVEIQIPEADKSSCP